MNISDEHLSAYIDGELDANMMASIDGAIESNPELSHRLEQLKKPDHVLSAVYNRINEVPVPDKLMRLLDQSDTPSVVQLRTDSIWRRPRQIFALAASLVVAVGVTLSLQNGNQIHETLPVAGALDLDSAVHTALETTISGQTFVSGETSVTPILTFRSMEGSYCREFEMTSNEIRNRALACRTAKHWSMRAVIGNAQPTTETQGYSTASSEHAQFDRIVNNMMAGQALDHATEERLIRKDFIED